MSAGPLLAVEVAPYGDNGTDIVEALRKVSIMMMSGHPCAAGTALQMHFASALTCTS